MNRLHDTIYANRDEMIHALARLVAQPSVSGVADGKFPFGKPCGAVLDEFESICAQLGFALTNYDYFAASVDLGEHPKLGILGHLDVVPASADDWATPPFRCVEQDGRLFGRGVMDDKGPVIAALYALKAVRDCGYKLKSGVRLIVGCSEETGDLPDIKHYLSKAAMPENVFTPDGEYPIVTVEKGQLHFHFDGSYNTKLICEIRAGTVINAVPSIATARLKCAPEAVSQILGNNITAEKDGEFVILTAQGAAAHAYLPQNGLNALTMLLCALSGLALDGDDLQLVQSLVRLFPHGEIDGKSLGIARNDDTGTTTCVFSLLNFENSRLDGGADARLPAAISAQTAISACKSALQAEKLDFSCLHSADCHQVDNDSEFVQTLLRNYAAVTGRKPYCKAIGGGTYVHSIEGGVAFGMELDGENNNLHGANEWITIDNLLSSTEIFARAIVELCGGQLD